VVLTPEQAHALSAFIPKALTMDRFRLEVKL
jgi:hypothetical protein